VVDLGDDFIVVVVRHRSRKAVPVYGDVRRLECELLVMQMLIRVLVLEIERLGLAPNLPAALPMPKVGTRYDREVAGGPTRGKIRVFAHKLSY
jgi:hypothetical protein